MATKTINLTGAEVAVTGLDGAHAHIRNDGTEVIYAAKTAGITAGADGVASIPAGQSDTIRGISGAVYLLGTGSVLIQSDDYVASPFKTSAASGGSGADEVARTAINTHAGNDEIHVTASEKASWDGKAELTDIPTSLPANGGNADTVDGFHSSDFIRNLVYWETGNVKELALNSHSGFVFVGNSVTGMPYNAFWFVTIEKTTSHCKLTATNIDDNVSFVATYSATTQNWSAWKNIADGGNADTLDGKHASDFVLKSDYDALAARVTTLEGGTT